MRWLNGSWKQTCPSTQEEETASTQSPHHLLLRFRCRPSCDRGDAPKHHPEPLDCFQRAALLVSGHIPISTPLLYGGPSGWI
ncbi:hypothetical protein JTE90_018153 [Oedothorax gibbosus]|uniref:Uncharacterized protein n=1 Tax=Oedothorax gibbosus TaxID=931172 RepID=A0AAV6U9K8_9ARAC|nr:hypothetical protein JTE90_018153 [Oedothorax gibbosus]